MKKLMMVLLIALLTGCGGEQQSETQQQPSLEHKFAIVNAGTMIPETDSSVARARELLKRATLEYGDTPEKIADMSITAAKLLSNDGIEVKPLDVLEAAALTHVGDGTPAFAKTASAYLGLRKNGMSHAEAIVGLKGLLQIATGKR